jgi:hypothetical protein
MTIVCVSSITLISERGTPCHLMRAMAERVPVIYINPPHSYARARRQLSTDVKELRVITPRASHDLPLSSPPMAAVAR